MANPVIALSIDSAPEYAFLASRCVRSLREAGTRLSIIVFASEGAHWSGPLDVELVRVKGYAHSNTLLEKWFRLARLDTERVVFLDADTVSSQPIERLLDRYSDCDVYAREELGLHRSGRYVLAGRFKIAQQYKWSLIEEQRRQYSSKNVPILNTGVVILNHRAVSVIATKLELLRRIHDAWAEGVLEYPSTNPHVAEELAVSYMLGTTELRVGLLDPVDVPYYLEIMNGQIGHAIVTHIFRRFCGAYLFERSSREELARFEELSNAADNFDRNTVIR